MGSFSNLINFFSSQLYLLPMPATVTEINYNHTSDSSLLSTSLTQHYSGRTKLFDRESEAILQQKEQAIRRFPCEDRHSYNPHYQHNLISELPSYSTPPSLSSSPTNSSPASFASFKSSMSCKGSRATYGYSSGKNSNYHHHSHQSRSSDQHSNSHPGFSGYNTVGSNGGRQYSYMRQQQRQQNQLREYYEYMNDDLMIGASSMALFSPGEVAVLSPSSSTSSLASSSRQINYKPQQPARQSASRISTSIASLSSLLENQVSPSKSSVAFSPMGRHHSHSSRRGGDPFCFSVGLLPSISETNAPSSKMDHASALGATSSSSPLPSLTKNQASKKMTAQKSLRRIAQCASNQDNWCSAKAGQWTSHYAEMRSRGAMTDGRRHRRL
ncbi:hypothetical protein MVEG_02706 [Podila verticillata NRRL 6337]|nr:hypothetical protein MVEG_02706 [Podila verticillata NRRL 6337]